MMHYLKQHWQIAAGGIFGLFLLFYLVRKMNAGTSPDISNGSSSHALDAAASLQNAQVNGQVEMAQLQAQVGSNQIAAQLQANLAMTAAQEATTSQKIAADTVVSLQGQQTAIQLQHVLSDADIAKTQIVGTTLTTLGVTAGKNAVALQAEKNKPALQSIANTNAQIMYGVQHDTGHLASYLDHLKGIILSETGQGTAAVGVEQVQKQADIANGPGAIVSSITGGIASVFGGLFG